jgi:Flp pilus assembly protein TadD
MVLQLKPGDAPTHYNLGTALIQKGDVAAAMDHFQMALQIKPNYPEALNDLAWELATSAQPSARNGNQSVALAQRANQLTGGTDLDIVGTLAAAYAEAGQFDEAIVTVQKSIELARTTGRQDQLSQLNDELKLYAARMPFHQDNK